MISWHAIRNEAGVLAVFLAGLLVAARCRRRWTMPEMIVMYALGLLFELLSAHMWNYHDILLILPTQIDNDVSVLFPFGWAGLIMIATSTTEALWRRWRMTSWWKRHAVLVVVWLVVGDLVETTFYRIGMIEYVNDESTKANFSLGQVPGLPPTMILVGYGMLQPFASHYMRWLERGLERPVLGAPR